MFFQSSTIVDSMLLSTKKDDMNIVHKIKMKFKKPNLVAKIEVVTDNCIGCGICVRECKRKVFEMKEGRAIVAHKDLCVGCGKCVERMCNFEGINLVLA